jgi:hypothetical protein
MRTFILLGSLFFSAFVQGAETNLFYVTDDGFLISKYHNQISMNPRKVQEAKKLRESLPANQYPEGNWGEPTNGFQLSLHFEKQVFTNGESIMATTLMRNITNTELAYFFPIQIMAMKDGKILKRKSDPGVSHITMPPSKTVYPQTQNKSEQNLSSNFILDENGTYFFQAVCHHPEVNSEVVTILITNNVSN